MTPLQFLYSALTLQVHEVLGISRTANVLGPGGQQHWQDADPQAKKDADELLRYLALLPLSIISALSATYPPPLLAPP